MSEVLEVTVRESVGKLNNRRLRRAGQLPAILYGHGKASVSLTVSVEQLDSTLRHGAKVVQLQGAAKGQAFLQNIQWDTFQQNVLHVDLLRVDAKDRVHVEVPLVLRGEAPGVNEGGIVEHQRRSVEIETSPANIPEALHLNINSLHLGEALRIADIEDLPKEAKFLADDQLVLVQCVEPTIISEDEEEPVGVGGVEPEIVGRKEDEEAGSGE